MKKLIFILLLFISSVGFSQYRIMNDLLILDGSDSVLINPDHATDTSRILTTNSVLEFEVYRAVFDTVVADNFEGVQVITFGSENQIPRVNATTNDFDYTGNYSVNGDMIPAVDVTDNLGSNSSAFDTAFADHFYSPNYNTTGYGLRIGDFVLQPYAANNHFIAENLIYNGGWKYINNGYGEGFQFFNGQFSVFNANTGSAGGVASRVISLKADFNGSIALGGNINNAVDNFTGAKMYYDLSDDFWTVNTDVIPGTDATYNLGGNANYWDTTFTDHLSVNTDILYQGNQFIKKSGLNYAIGSGNSNLSAAGSHNFIYGDGAGDDGMSGSFNVILGGNCGEDLTIGSNNVLIGYDAGQDITTGSGNIFFGKNTGTGSTNALTGGYNIGIGEGSLFNAQGAATQNTVLGSFAADDITTGSANIVIGYLAASNGDLTTESNKLWIENTNGSTPLIYGEFDNNVLGINSSSADSTLTINGSLHADWALFDESIEADTVYADVFTNKSDMKLSQSGSDITIDADNTYLGGTLSTITDSTIDIGKDTATYVTTTTSEAVHYDFDEVIYSKLAQTFTPTEQTTLRKASLKLKKIAGTGYIRCYLYSTSSNLPNTELSEADSINFTSLPTSADWVTFDFDNYTLTADTKYAIVIDAPSASSEDIEWYGAGSDVYSGGNPCVYNGSWGAAAYDVGLKIISGYRFKDLYLSGSATVNGYIKAYEMVHLFHYYGDSTISKSYTTSWATLTNASADMWIDAESDGFSVTNDTITIAESGDYEFLATNTCDGDNGETVSIRFYNITQTAGIPVASAATMRAAGNYYTIVTSGYQEIAAGDEIILQYKGDASGTSVFKNGTINIKLIHK